MSRCEECKYARWDYCDYYYGGRQWFVDDCNKGEDMDADECESFEEKDGE